MLLALALLLLQSPVLEGEPSPAANDAYLDARAAELVAAARAREEGENAAIDGYRVTARQRFDLGIRAFRRDRMIIGREVAAVVEWRRDGPRRIEVLGARQAAPIATNEVRVPWGDSFSDLVFEPGREWLLNIVSDSDEDGLVHPLAPGSEAHYRFRTGETTTILVSGRRIDVVELQVLPRRSVATLVSGSFWLDAATNAAVRGVFTLAAPAVLDLSAEAEMRLLPLPDPSLTLEYLTIEYGLWEGRWWLPRVVALEGRGDFGRLSVPLLLEQRFEDYEVYAAGEPLPPFPPPDTTRYHVRRNECEEAEDECVERVVLIPLDTAAVIASPHLPDTPFGGQRLTTPAELEQIVALVEASARRSTRHQAPDFSWSALDSDLFRYNRVEGLRAGSTLAASVGPLVASASAWIGTGNWRPGGEIALERRRPFGRSTLELYHRVDAFDPQDRPFGLASSFSAAVLGRDDGDYYRATGAAVALERRAGSGQELRLELYAEAQRPVEANTDVSVARWLNGRAFRPNPAAATADQLGVLVDLGFRRGRAPNAPRLGLDLQLRAERGDFIFARPAAAATLSFPLPGRFAAAIEAGAGTSFGDLPLQRSWSVGGISTVRGFHAEDRVRGDAYWSARTEIGTDFPAARAVLFTDLGWAGPREHFASRAELASAGVGVSLLDGLLRADLARAVHGGSGWRVHLHLDAPL